MAAMYNNSDPRLHNSGRRIIVVGVPAVDELDLVGPLQVFNSVNRLAGRKIYGIELVINTHSLTVEGKGEVLTFIAKRHFNKVEGTLANCFAYNAEKLCRSGITPLGLNCRVILATKHLFPNNHSIA